MYCAARVSGRANTSPYAKRVFCTSARCNFPARNFYSTENQVEIGNSKEFKEEIGKSKQLQEEIDNSKEHQEEKGNSKELQDNLLLIIIIVLELEMLLKLVKLKKIRIVLQDILNRKFRKRNIIINKWEICFKLC